MVPFLLASGIFLDVLQGGVSFTVGVIPYVGLILAMAINLCLSATFGSGHALGLYLHATDRLSRFSRLQVKIEAYVIRRILIILFGELIPVLNILPLWTIATAMALHEIHKQELKQQQAEKEASAAEEKQMENISLAEQKRRKKERAAIEEEGAPVSANDNEPGVERSRTLPLTQVGDGIRKARPSRSDTLAA